MKKELLAASLLAVGLAAGLGTLSFGLFGEAPTIKPEAALDVYTLKGGIGINATGGTFEPGDSAIVCAYLTLGGVPVNNSQTTFSIKKPDATQVIRTTLTNGSGVAEVSLSFLPSEGHMIGTWQIIANATPSNLPVSDTVMLQVESENARIDVFPEKNGVFSLSFLPSDQVFLEARLSYRNNSVAGTPVTFEVRTPNEVDFSDHLSPAKTVSTDGFGVASVTFQIPWPSDISLGTWRVTVGSQIYEQGVNATTDFDCRLVPPTIDVYTQKSGQGQNAQGGSFMLNETVSIYAEIRDSLNKTVSGQIVGFEFRYFNTTSVPWTEFTLVQETDTSGIAGVSTRIPPFSEYAGTWIVYATTRYNDVILSDTLPFVANQQ